MDVIFALCVGSVVVMCQHIMSNNLVVNMPDGDSNNMVDICFMVCASAILNALYPFLFIVINFLTKIYIILNQI